MSTNSYTADQVTEYLGMSFAAPLIISTIAWMLYGANLCQVVDYFSISAKRDHLFTKTLVCVVMLFNSASLICQVCYNWIQSIAYFTCTPATSSVVNGMVIFLYSVVVMLAQLFWLSCIKKSMNTRPKLCWTITIPLALVSFSSFAVTIAATVLTIEKPEPGGGFPIPIVSTLLRVSLGLDLGVDLAVLIVLVTQLTLMKRNTRHHKATISRLSWILMGTTLISTLIVAAEVVVNGPIFISADPAIPIAISFSPLIPTVYSFGILAVLNARAHLWIEKRGFNPQSNDCTKELIPGLRFTVDLPDPR